MKTITSYTLKFILLGKDKQTYLRYYCTCAGVGMTLNIPCEVLLSPDQLKALNTGTLGGLIQKSCYLVRNKYLNVIEALQVKNSSYPLPDQLKEYFNVTEKEMELSYLINKYLITLSCKESTKNIYSYALNLFKKYFDQDIHNQSIKQIISKNTIDNYCGYLITSKYISQQDYENNLEDVPTIKYSPITMHNSKGVVLKFLNYIANLYNLPLIEYKLHIPAQSSKWHINAVDVQRLLDHIPSNNTQLEVQEIITLNSCIGMRITDLLAIQQDNISFDADCAYIRFIEHKRTKERTVVVVNADAQKILKHFNGWLINDYHRFNYALKEIAKEVFKNETVNIYKIDTASEDYVSVKKYMAISSHCFRRFAIEQNIINYGIDTARSLSGHTNYQTITRHYAEFINKEDLKNILLKR